MKSAISSKKKFTYLKSVATPSSFINILKRNPNALHISCHGIKNEPETVGYMHKDDGDFLLFENGAAEGELVSEK